MLHNIKNKNLSNNAWIRRQINDPYVLKAKSDGYRSRAAFKLIEIEEKFHFIKHANKILDLGSAPGSWLQIIAKFSGKHIIGIDLLPLEAIPNTTILTGDFISQEIQDQLIFKNFDLILSDLAPNTTGSRSTDHLKLMTISEEVVLFSQKHLNINGSLVMKAFQGVKTPSFIKNLKEQFKKVSFFKPKASRQESVEIYLICQNKLDCQVTVC